MGRWPNTLDAHEMGMLVMEVVTTPNSPLKAMPYASKGNDYVLVAKKIVQCSFKMANNLLCPSKDTSLTQCSYTNILF